MGSGPPAPEAFTRTFTHDGHSTEPVSKGISVTTEIVQELQPKKSHHVMGVRSVNDARSVRSAPLYPTSESQKGSGQQVSSQSKGLVDKTAMALVFECECVAQVMGLTYGIEQNSVEKRDCIVSMLNLLFEESEAVCPSTEKQILFHLCG